MAKFVATDHKITVNGVNLSNSLQSIDLTIQADEVDTTTFGGNFKTVTGGLLSGSVTLNFYQDFGSAAVDQTLWPLLNTAATVVITPTSATVSSTNPSYSAVCLVSQYQPFASTVGDLATLSVTWPTSGTVTRATA
jgi:hypothetical protein